MKIDLRIGVVFILIAVFLIVAITVLYIENIAFSKENENPVLENDSIISVNIQLQDSIHKIIPAVTNNR